MASFDANHEVAHERRDIAVRYEREVALLIEKVWRVPEFQLETSHLSHECEGCARAEFRRRRVMTKRHTGERAQKRLRLRLPRSNREQHRHDSGTNPQFLHDDLLKETSG